MDHSQFTSRSPGSVVKIPDGGYAFVPDALPANFEFPLELWPLLADAKSKVSLLEGIGRHLPHAGLLIRPLEDREALQSTRLEGTYITAKEFLLFELEPREADGDDGSVNDWREVHNYRKAIQLAGTSDLPLSLRLIRELHRTLMTGVKRGDMTPGEFRTHQVAIGYNRRFVPPPPQQVLGCLSDFETFLHAGTRIDPLIHCFLCHYQFEAIHPFHDGNGRVGRLLLGLMLHKHCGLTKPWLYMSDILEQWRQDYCDALFNVSASGDWTGWLDLCLRATIAQADATILRCERLQRLREEYLQRLASTRGNVRLQRILEGLFVSPFVRPADLVERLEVTYPTAKSDCQRMKDIGVLTELPQQRPATFVALEIFQIAYENIGDVEARDEH